MPAYVTCAGGQSLELAVADMQVWTNGQAEGYTYWCPCCQRRHRGRTTRANLIKLLAHGATVHDPDLWGD